MVRKKLRRIRLQSKRKPQPKRSPATNRVTVETAASSASQSAAPPVCQPAALKKQDIASKLIPLSLLSAKDAQKKAEKEIDHVLTAITHALSEGDLNIDGFGDFKATKTAKTGTIGISFMPHDKLKQAVEARLSAAPSATPVQG